MRFKLQILSGFAYGPELLTGGASGNIGLLAGQKLTGTQRGYSTGLLSVPRISPRMLRNMNWLLEERNTKRKT